MSFIGKRSSSESPIVSVLNIYSRLTMVLCSFVLQSRGRIRIRSRL